MLINLHRKWLTTINKNKMLHNKINFNNNIHLHANLISLLSWLIKVFFFPLHENTTKLQTWTTLTTQSPKIYNENPQGRIFIVETLTERQSSGRGFVGTIAPAAFDSTSSLAASALTSSAALASAASSESLPDFEQKKALLLRAEWSPTVNEPKIRSTGDFASVPLQGLGANLGGRLRNRAWKQDDDKALNMGGEGDRNPNRKRSDFGAN